MRLTDLQTVMLLLNIISSLIIVWKGVFHVINCMTKHTRFIVRLAWIWMTVGAVAVLAGPLFGVYITGTYGTLIHMGLALFILSERRVSAFSNV